MDNLINGSNGELMEDCQRGTLEKQERSCHCYKAAGPETILVAGMGHLLPVPPAQSQSEHHQGDPLTSPLPQPGLLEFWWEAESTHGETNQPTSLPFLASPAAMQGTMCIHQFNWSGSVP